MRTVQRKIAWLGVLAALAMLVAPTQAQTVYTWMPGGNRDAGGNWDLSTPNWNSGGGQTAWANGNTADFGPVTTERTVTLTVNVTADTIVFRNLRNTWGQDWVINATGGNRVTLSGNARIDFNSTAANNNAVRINAPISGSAGLNMTVSGTGTRDAASEFRLGGNNDYTGITYIRNSRLVAYHDNAFGATGAGNDTVVSHNGAFMLGGVGGGSTPVTVAEDVQVLIQDANSANTFAIRSHNANNVLNGSVTFITGSAAANNDRGFIVGTDHTLTVNGPVAVNRVGTATTPRIILQASGGPASALIINGNITESGVTARLLINGSGTAANSGNVVLNGVNTFTGNITVRGGRLLIGNNQALGTNASAEINIADSGSGGAGQVMGVLTNGPYTVNKLIAFQTFSGTAAYTGVIGGATAHTSNFTGEIRLQGDSNTTNIHQLTAAAGGMVYFSGLITDGTATKALNKTGAGTVVLSRAAGNTFKGGMNVQAGTLLVTNTSGSGTGTGAVTVASGATLGGTGLIAGATTINGTLSPGDSPGTLTFSDSLTLGSGSISLFELNGTNTTIGGGINDLVNVGGAFTLDGTLNVVETVAGSFMSAAPMSTWRLFNYSGSLVNNVMDLGAMPSIPSGWSFQLDTSTAGQVNLVLIPEPGTVGLLMAGVALMAMRRRMRR